MTNTYILPEPYSTCIDADWTSTQLYNAAQMREAHAQGQRDMREEAAKRMEVVHSVYAEVIRALPINAELSTPQGVTWTPGYRADFDGEK